jgi:hypothetical protein
MAFLRHISFDLSDVSLQRNDSANRRPCLADGGGWREDQHMWDGQGLKDPCYF